MNLPLLYEELGTYFKNKNSNSMLLIDMKIPTKAISSVLSSNLYIYATYFCVEFCQVLLTLVEKVIMPQDQDHIHPHIQAIPTLEIC
jgi:hypothetical protein